MTKFDSQAIYTVCPECQSPQNISQDKLKGVISLVACSNCGMEFNAAWNLKDLLPRPSILKDKGRSYKFDSINKKEKQAAQNSEGSDSVNETLILDNDNFRHRTEPRLNLITEEGNDSNYFLNENKKYTKKNKSYLYKTKWFLIGCCLALFGVVLQLNTLFPSHISELKWVDYLVTEFCQYTNCDRIRNLNYPDIVVIHTSVDLHKKVPDAVTLKVHILNRDSKNHSYPSLELTITNSNDEVIGRRVYLPKEFGVTNNSSTIGSGRATIITLVLDKPDLAASGFKVRAVRS